MKKRKPASRTTRPAKKAAAKTRVKEGRPPSGDEVTESAAFRRATSEAEAYAGDPKLLRELLRNAVGKMNVIPRGPFGDAWPYLLAMIRLGRAHQRNEYREISRPKLLMVVAALIYFVSPFDVIPDWLPVLGHIDDAFVVTLALKSVRTELDAFMAWETAKI
jgi:uncharacterized membrane protein YkvA (DUF1232 family)